MKFGLFAAEEVGLEVIQFLKAKGQTISVLVVDSKDPKQLNRAIIDTLEVEAVFYSDSLYKGDTVNQLKKMALDIIILAWWPYIIKPPLISVPRLGCINMHPSLLPHNKGKHPYFWSIVEGHPFGVTLHYIDEGIDSGDIIFQKELTITWTDTGSTLSERGRDAIVELFKDRFDDIKSGKLPRTKQTDRGTFHYKKELIGKSIIQLDQQYTARELLNLLRARSWFPSGACVFKEGGKTYEVRVRIAEIEADNLID